MGRQAICYTPCNLSPEARKIAVTGVATGAVIRYRKSMAFDKKVFPSPVCPLPSQARRDTLGRAALAFIVAIAFVTRALQFGNPVIQVDEQFYLLAGDRLLRGALPYVDIWDRKPFGLFALFAAIRELGGTGVIQYQIVATLFAAATAATIAFISLRLTGRRGATVAAIVYLLYILSSGGDGGQAPVFYNLPVAVAALIVLRIQERRSFDLSATGQACFAMALLGLAIQIKYTVIFEGAFFGLWLLGLAWRNGMRSASLAALALLWCSIALVPTMVVWVFYWYRGFADQFVFQNFISIFVRSSHDLDIPGRLFAIGIHVALPLAIAIWGMTVRVGDHARAAQIFIGAWASIAVIAVLGFGTYHNHYALPLFAPLAAAGAAVYGDPQARLRLGPFRPHVSHVVMMVGLLLGVGTMIGTRLSRGTGDAVYAAARLVGPTPDDCIFVFGGDPVLYHFTNSCLPTAYVFPSLLSEKPDANSLGRDQMTELRATMATRPRYVFVREPMLSEGQPAAWNFMRLVLGRDYKMIFQQRAGASTLVGYARKCATRNARCQQPYMTGTRVETN
jgi:hypothetical protein